MTQLSWLPPSTEWRSRVRMLQGSPADVWEGAIGLAGTNLNFVQTNALDSSLRTQLGELPPAGLSTKPVRLAVLSSSTVTHLLPAIRVAGLRRGIHIAVYECDYGQYWQELTDTNSNLYKFQPTAVLLALDAHHLAAELADNASSAERQDVISRTLERVQICWKLASEKFGCHVIHQTALPIQAAFLGNNEHRFSGSQLGFIRLVNQAVRNLADQAGVDLLAVDDRAAVDGLSAWHDPSFWYQAKQEVSLTISPLYGDLVARLIAARQGRSYKCLVLDLDNTLWGGVVGDDGLEGLVLGQGSALGEAYVAFQKYAKALSRRGIILAVCSKNDEANALEPFDKHPDMVLRREDIAVFVANWNDKATNLRAVAKRLNIGIDSVVFVDDNPFERTLVRQELPLVAVPEVSDDPARFSHILADAGYFEGVAITEEDLTRSGQYQGNLKREELMSSSTDLDAYLRSLDMVLQCKNFDSVGLQRIVQLINKTNQFNLTTRRYSDADVTAVMQNPKAFGLQLRLLDRFGDNGIISIIIGKLQDNLDLAIDTWLMSCRVLGRQVEVTTLNLIAEEALRLGARRLVGTYVPTKKNGMVKNHYEGLGFSVMEVDANGESKSILDLSTFSPSPTFVQTKKS